MSDLIKEISDATFADEVTKSSGLALVDFWAPWCGPCRMLTSILEKIAAQYKDKLSIFKLNTDENPETAGKYNISAIPNLIFFKNGQVADQIVGVRPLEELKKNIDTLL